MRVLPVLLALALSACHSGQQGAPGDAAEHRPYDGIGADEVLHFTGTEPFWGGEVKGTRMVYSTPDNEKGEAIAVQRFAGRGGVSFSGVMAAGQFTMAVAPGQCSDGMSDRTYPFEVMVKFASGTTPLQGCGWTSRQPFREDPDG